jgi:hypothetical protein
MSRFQLFRFAALSALILLGLSVSAHSFADETARVGTAVTATGTDPGTDSGIWGP